MSARRRRVAFLAATVLALTVAIPSGAVPRNGGFPMAWLWSWLSAPPAWASFDAFRHAPVQPDARGRDEGHYVSTSQTRASGGAGIPAGHSPDALPPDTPPVVPKKDPWTAPSATGFDPQTSRRLPERSTAYADTFQNADGSLTRRVYTTPRNYRAADGTYQPADPTLVRRGNRFEMAAGSVGVSVSALASAGRSASDALASLTLPSGEVFAYGLGGAASVAADVSGPTATYHEVLPATDLQLQPLNGGLKETIVLRSADAATSWVFPLRLDGLMPKITAAGSVELVNSAGTVVGTIPAGSMTDSKFNPETGTMATSEGVHYDLTTVDGAPALKVTADEAWIKDPARVFPVRIDPTAYAGTTQDAFVDNDTTGPSQQNGVDLTVGTYDNGTHIARSFVGFSSFESNGFTGLQITSATLYAYLSWTYDCNHAQTVVVYNVTSPWTESDLAYQGLWGPSVGRAIGSNYPSSNYPACTNTSADRSIGS